MRDEDLEDRLAAEEAKKRLLVEALNDFPTFCTLLKIRNKDLVEQPLVLKRIQKEYLKNRTQRDIVLKARQVFMTTVLLALDLFHFLTKPGARVVIVCQSSSGNEGEEEIAKPLRMYIESLRKYGLDLNFSTEKSYAWAIAERDASMKIIGAGASEASADKKGRAGRISRLHVTEVAMFEYAEETMRAILQCVPHVKTGSEVVFESTPRGAGGYFYEKWQDAVNGKIGYKAHFFPWWMHEEYRTPLETGESFRPTSPLEKKLTQEQIKWHRQETAEKGESTMLQEFPNDPVSCFLSSGRGFFPADRIALTLQLSESVKPVNQEVLRKDGADGWIRYWHMPSPGRSYVVALDTAEGIEANKKNSDPDRAAGIVLERGTGRHMATIWGKLRPEQLAKAAVHVARKYNGAEIAVERNFHGTACILALTVGHQMISEVRPWGNMFRDMDGKVGWLTTEASRTPALDNLEIAFRGGHFNTLDHALAKEMHGFIVNHKGRAEANKGCHDDLVMVAAIAWNVICRRRTHRDFSELPHA